MKQSLAGSITPAGVGMITSKRARVLLSIIAQLHDKFKQHIEQFCEQIRKALSAQVDVSVTAGMATFFAEFSLCLTGLQETCVIASQCVNKMSIQPERSASC